MIGAVTLLLVCQLAGETAQRLVGLPVPGPVLGMLLLLAILAVRRDAPAPVADTADGILRNLSLLFVPAGVGIVQQLDLVARHGLALLLVMVASTVLALVVTALVFRALAPREAGPDA